MKDTEYSPDVIQAFANKLYSQANSMIAAYALLGAVIGAVGGYIILQMMGAIIGLIIVGLLGFSMGQSKAFTLKLQAQTALCQVQTEKNTRK